MRRCVSPSVSRAVLFAMLAFSACGGGLPPMSKSSVQAGYDPVAHGRALVLEYDCGACHGGGTNPASKNWLSGARTPDDDNMIGPCASDPKAKPCFITRARNLTPDVETGLGRYSERQIFNAIRHGLLVSSAPDQEITSNVPGKGNFPANPKYLAPPMPWMYWRHMSDQELMAIAAYLKRGLKPVSNKVAPSDAPPDGWASEFTEQKIGTYPPPAYPTAMEVLPPTADEAMRRKLARGRHMVISHACGACHGGPDPASDRWLSGSRSEQDNFKIEEFVIRPRNLTPDNVTGMGRFSERQIFNSLRFGLRPGETPDVEITSTKPGEGNFPLHPKFLAPPMPWPAWRHMSDSDLWAIAAYLKHGVKPVRHKVEDSDGPPDFWASAYAERLPPYPAQPFPTANEVAQ